MKNKVSKERWEFAQKHEQQVWESITEESLKSHAKYYKKKADRLLKEANKKIKITDKTKFLQIGCGPDDIINQIKVGKRDSIDPLADFYKSKFKFDYKGSNLIQGVGEDLPYPDKHFDIVIFANVLDHTNHPEKTLSEINRVLKSEGLMYVEVHFYQKGFIWLSKIYGLFKKTFTGKIFNPCHPHMFQLGEIKQLLSKNFKIHSEKIGEDIEKEIDNTKELRKYLIKQKFTKKLPAMFGLLGIINYTCFCKKN